MKEDEVRNCNNITLYNFELINSYLNVITFI